MPSHVTAFGKAMATSLLVGAAIPGVGSISTPYTQLALFRTARGGQSEITGGAYARVDLNRGATVELVWDESRPFGALLRNTAQLAFPIATADWPTVTHLGTTVATAVDRGDVTASFTSYYLELSSPVTIESGDQFVIEPYNLLLASPL